MNNKYRVNIGFLFLLCLSQLVWMHSALAKQCFIDVKHAHAYMISQQQLEQQSRKAAQNTHIINLNTATESELTTLEGIGITRAKEIILYREAFGPFKSVEALAKVNGVGALTVDKNKYRMTVK